MFSEIEKIKEYSYWAFWSILVLILASFSSAKQSERTCENIHIHVDNQMDNFFIEETDVISLMTNGNKKRIKGLNKEALSVKNFEDLIKSNRFVLQSKVSIAHNGDIYIRVKENKPIARVFTENGSFYLDEKGRHLPLSTNYTARVVVINAKEFQDSKTGDYFANEGLNYTNLVNYIEDDNFWKKQVAEIKINRKGKVNLYSNVGREKVVFGNPIDIETKFQKLGIYFKKILPSVGWNKYKIVNLEFSDQIVCE